MSKRTSQTQEITLENWQFSLAPLSTDEQRKIMVAIAGIEKIADHLQIDSHIGEMDFVAACFADLVSQDSIRKGQIHKLFNHTLARALNKQS